MKYLKGLRPLSADTQQWRQIRLTVSLPRDRSQGPAMSLLLLEQHGRVPTVAWIESWEAERPLGDPESVEKVYEWLLDCCWDRLDQ